MQQVYEYKLQYNIYNKKKYLNALSAIFSS